MSRILATSSLVLFALTGAACVGGHRGGPIDSGVHPDGGSDTDSGPGHDGSIVLPDSGPGHDSGTPGFDAGTPGGDGGCGAVVPRIPAGMVYCDSTTYDCLTSCTAGDTTCVDNCYAADSHMGDCEGCVSQDNVSCANASGCMSQWVAYDCCFSAHCPMGSAATCGMTNCPSQLSAYNSCFMTSVTASTPCAGDLLACFGM